MSKLITGTKEFMVGKLFNNLWVLKEAEIHDRWVCRCLCGNIKVADGKSIRKGFTRSCGCYRKSVKKEYKDLTDMVFGYLTVLEWETGSRKKRWICRCVCGNLTTVNRQSLKSGKCKSCGCMSHKMRTETLGLKNISKNSYYKIWEKMVSRIENKNQKGYHNYGGRGIKVEEPWRSNPETFIKWYEEQLELRPNMVRPQVNRIDNDKNYCESNCEVIPLRENNFNKRCNIKVEYNGQLISLAKFYHERELIGMPIASYTCFSSRMKTGKWDIEDAISTPSINLAKANKYRDFYYQHIDTLKISYAHFNRLIKRVGMEGMVKKYGKTL